MDKILLLVLSLSLFSFVLCTDSFDYGGSEGSTQEDGYGGDLVDAHGGLYVGTAQQSLPDHYEDEHKLGQSYLGGNGDDKLADTSDYYGREYGSYEPSHTINAAILSQRHSVKAIPVHSSGGNSAKPTHIEVDASTAPIKISLYSRSSPIYVTSKHLGLNGSFKKSHSRDKPHKLLHMVTKPIFMNLKEIIMPYRKITQKVRPVKQRIQTFVHQGKHHGGYGH